MQLIALPKRTLLLLTMTLLALVSAAFLTSAPAMFIVTMIMGLGAIALMGVGLMPDVRHALKTRLDTPRGELVCILATVIFFIAAATCLTVWWVLAPRDAELQRPVMTGNLMALLMGAAAAMALSGPIAWRWVAFRLLSRPVSSLPFFRTTSGAMRLLIVLSLVFLLFAPELYDALQPWIDQPALHWLEGLLRVVHWSLGSVVILAFLSGVSQLLQRAFGPRQHPRSLH
ncbi:hypothetical protein D3C81_652130 [compost metagenome]